MRFLVDAHLPRGLCALLIAAGHDALHTTQLPDRNRTADRTINDLSLAEQRIVITKDTDFYFSLVLYQRPYKLMLVRTGNSRTQELLRLFERELTVILEILEQNYLVELDRSTVRAVR